MPENPRVAGRENMCRLLNRIRQLLGYTFIWIAAAAAAAAVATKYQVVTKLSLLYGPPVSCARCRVFPHQRNETLVTEGSSFIRHLSRRKRFLSCFSSIV